MRATLSIFLFALALALSPCANAQADCGFGDEARVWTESAGDPATTLVHSHVEFGMGVIPYSPVVTRAGNAFTIKYTLPQAVPAMPNIWDDTFSLGALPPGSYRVNIVFEVLGGQSICTLRSVDFLVAPRVPTLSLQALAGLCIALGAAGSGLLRVRLGIGV